MDMEEDYGQESEEDAKRMVDEFRDQIEEQLVDNDSASQDFNNDYVGGDSYHHENHVDRPYQLLEAAQLLQQLSDYEETDTGLWEGQQPEDAISTKAAFTYGNAVASDWSDLIDKINDEYDDMKDGIDSKFDEEDEDYDEEAHEKALRSAAAAAVEKVLGLEPNMSRKKRVAV